MKLLHIPIAKIDRNVLNPRGIDVVLDDTRLGLLRDSIEQFGILVPLVIMPKNGRYMLIDGERRYEAAKSLRLKNVPAYVTEQKLPDKDVLLRMFHIHHNREQWGAIQQCRALESVYDKIAKGQKAQKLKDEEAKIKFIAAQLVEKTGIDAQTARDRVLFLRWPRDVKDQLYKHPTDEYWYIREIENGIILPALRNYPEYFEKVPVDDVRRFLFEKIRINAVREAREVRVAAPIMKFETHKRSERRKVLRILDDLVTERNMTYQDARDEFNRKFPNANAVPPPSPRTLLTAICNLIEKIRMFDPQSFSTSVRRAKARKNEVLEASDTLMDELADLRARI